MGAILNSAILDSAILHKTLTQTNSIWLRLINSHSTWWCQKSWILPPWIQPFWTKKNFTHSLSLNLMIADILNSTILDSAILHKKTSLIHSHSTWWWQPSWILPSWIQTFCTKKNFTHSFSLNMMMAAILDSAILHKTLTQTNSIWLKLIHSESTWGCHPSWILPSWIQPFCTKLWLKLIQSDSDSFILTQLDDVRHHEFCHLGFNHFEEKKPHSFIVTQLDDDSHLRFSHFAPKNFTHSFWLNLMMAAILKSAMLDSDTAILDSDTLLSSLRFTQKHSHYSLTLTQTNSIWLKLIHSYLTWWCQPSWIWPSWIQPS